MLLGLLLVSTSGWGLLRSVAAPGWNWYKTDTHVHSVVSADALSDLGILSQTAKQQGYNALFLTDHNGASDFQITTWKANDVNFEDATEHWTNATFGSLASSTAEISTARANTGTASLRLRATGTASNSGERFYYEKRGPNFRSGDIILKVSVFPVRIDPGSGVYVSVSVGGDATASSSVIATPYQEGYTTQDGVPHPGKSTVLVWQLGSARTASSDPNARVVTQPLAYTLNQWNHYTINVSQALNDIPAADRPLDYNALTHLKMVARGNNGGTAEAYFDTYSLKPTNPKTPAEEYVYRTGVVDDFNTSSFKIFPSFEMGQYQHSQRFNFDITDPSQYRSYTYGTDGIPDTQQTGYPAMLNHPGAGGGVTAGDATVQQGYGADFIEVKDPAWTATWDSILKQGVPILGSFSSDTHSASGLSGDGATYIYAPALEFDPLMRSFFEGRTYNAMADFPGRVLFGLDSALQEPYPARYPVYVPANQTTAPVSLKIDSGLSSSYQVQWIVNGSVWATDAVSGSSYTATKTIPLSGPFTYVRAQVVRTSSGSIKAATQPIFFRQLSGLPAGTRLHVDGVTTPDARGYTRIFTKGITSSTWDTTAQALSLVLTNPAGSAVRLNVTTNSGPSGVKVDGVTVPPASSLTAFNNATGSSWYYDTTTKRLSLNVLQAGESSRVRIAFGASGGDTQPPTAPANLTATLNGDGQVQLSWSAATDNVGVVGYDVYRGSALIAPIDATTSYTDTTAGVSQSYTYTVRARDADENLSSPSNSVSINTPLFSDGFGSGNLLKWSSATGLTVESATGFDGGSTSVARANTATADPSYARKSFSSPPSELYARTRFKINSQSSTSTVSLLRFRTGEGTGGTQILSLFVTGAGKLQLRNDVAAQTFTSATTVTKGVWHEVQLRGNIAGAAGLMEVWYDGQKVTDLSKTADLGTAPTTLIGRLQLGEHGTGKSYDIIFDDVAASSQFIGTSSPPSDTTPPSTPVLTLTETIPEAHVAGSTLFYNPAVGSTSNVTVAASTTDAESAITQVAFPAVFGSDAVDDPSAALLHELWLECGSDGLRSEDGHGHQWGGVDRYQQLHRHPGQRWAGGLHAFGSSRGSHDPERASGLRGADRCALRGGAGCVPLLCWDQLHLECGHGDRRPGQQRPLLSDVDHPAGRRVVHPAGAGHRQRRQHDRLRSGHRDRDQYRSAGYHPTECGDHGAGGGSHREQRGEPHRQRQRCALGWRRSSSATALGRAAPLRRGRPSAPPTPRAPYAVSWTTQPANGPYTLVARATDTVGNTTDSAPVTVTVTNAGPPPPPTDPHHRARGGRRRQREQSGGEQRHQYPAARRRWGGPGPRGLPALRRQRRHRHGAECQAAPLLPGGDRGRARGLPGQQHHLGGDGDHLEQQARTRHHGPGRYRQDHLRHLDRVRPGRGGGSRQRHLQLRARAAVQRRGRLPCPGEHHQPTAAAADRGRHPTRYHPAECGDHGAGGRGHGEQRGEPHRQRQRCAIWGGPGRLRLLSGQQLHLECGHADWQPRFHCPLRVSWTSQPADGSYTLLARATDQAGNTTDSAPITVTVSNPTDTTPPSLPVLTLTETIPEAHVAGSTLFYNPAVGSGGGVTVSSSTTDAESGIAQVTFPAVFGGDGATDPPAPYSTSYGWSAGATASGAKTVTATNGAGLTATGSFTVTPDSQGPATFALTAPADGATIQNGQAVSTAPTDALSGVAQVEFRYCAGASCAFTAGTAIGAADTTAPYAVSWTTQPANGPYTLVARATDTVGNTTDSAPVTVTVTNAGPPRRRPPSPSRPRRTPTSTRTVRGRTTAPISCCASTVGRTRTARATCASPSAASPARCRVPSCASSPRRGPRTVPRSTRSATPPGRRRGSPGATSPHAAPRPWPISPRSPPAPGSSTTWARRRFPPTAPTASCSCRSPTTGSTSMPGRTPPTNRSCC